MLHLVALLFTITVSFVQTGDGASVQSLERAAVADLGTVSANESANAGVQIAHKLHSYTIDTTIGMRATSDSSQQPVALQAYLDDPLSGVTVRLDGVALTTMPQTFALNVPLGIVTRHRLEIEVPNFMPSAQIPQDIRLEVGALEE
jgi:hypothetical protein